MIIQLSKSYTCRYGTPVIDRVDSLIFELKYFAHCMACNFCNDWCCWHGADVDAYNTERLHAKAAELEKYIGVPKEEWFDPSEICEDDEAPGKVWFRTSVKNGACVFLNPEGRGCMLHSFSVNNNLDYHDFKPLVCAIFPLTFEEGLLVYADELDEKSLVCAGQGLSLFEGVRNELQYYFGAQMVSELESVQRNLQSKAGARI
jgi:Fe-S-cluster containining protein